VSSNILICENVVLEEMSRAACYNMQCPECGTVITRDIYR